MIPINNVRGHVIALLGTLTVIGCSADNGDVKTNADRVPSASAVTSQGTSPSPTLRVVVLGSGTPIPSRSQASTTLLIEAGDEKILFDCGRGCGTRLNEYDPSLYARIDTLFFTHLHSDHIVGLPDIWLNGWSMGRQTPLRIYGPVGTASMLSGLREAYAADIGYRTGYTSEEDPKALDQVVSEFGGAAQVFNVGDVTVTAFPVVHADIPAYGFRIDYKDHSVLISGDTTVAPGLIEYGQDLDAALMEVLSPAMEATVRRQFAPAKADAVVALHLTAAQAGETLAQMGPDLAVFYHTVATCQTDPDLLAQTQAHYDGALRVSRDLMVIDIDGTGAPLSYRGEDPADCPPS